MVAGYRLSSEYISCKVAIQMSVMKCESARRVCRLPVKKDGPALGLGGQVGVHLGEWGSYWGDGGEA